MAVVDEPSSELRNYLNTRLVSGEVLRHCAFGLDREEGLRKVGAAVARTLDAWTGGDVVLAEGHGLGTTTGRLLVVRVTRVRKKGAPRTLFNDFRSYTYGQIARASLSIERRDDAILFELGEATGTLSLRFALTPHHPDNLRAARALCDALEEARRAPPAKGLG